MKSTSSRSGQKTCAIASPFLAIFLTFTWLGLSGATTMAETNSTTPADKFASDTLPRTDTSSFAKHHQENQKQPTRPAAKVSRQQATEIALKKVSGVVTSVVIERKQGKHVYVVEIIAKEDGVETDVFVDTQSGEVVGTDK